MSYCWNPRFIGREMHGLEPCWNPRFFGGKLHGQHLTHCYSKTSENFQDNKKHTKYFLISSIQQGKKRKGRQKTN